MAAGIAVFVIACGAIAAGWGYVRVARRMRTFATTRGTVVHREICAVPSGGREGRWGRGGGYQPKVTYRYRVGGIAYTADRWSYAAQGLKRTVAQAELAKVSDEVDVYYDPVAPQDAYLRKSTATVGYFLVVGGALGVLGALLALLG